jgi:hypothetical protein
MTPLRFLTFILTAFHPIHVFYLVLTIIFFMPTAFELEKIKSNLIKEGLDPFYCFFELTRVDLDITKSSNVVQAVLSTVVTTGNALFAWYVAC